MLKSRKVLFEKYCKNYEPMMGNFLFGYSEVTFEIMQDFNGWKINAYNNGEENIVIFYEED